MKSRLIAALLITVIVFLLLSFSAYNPTRDGFVHWLNRRCAAAGEAPRDGTAFNDYLITLFGPEAISSRTTQYNFLIFSLYRTTFEPGIFADSLTFGALNKFLCIYGCNPDQMKKKVLAELRRDCRQKDRL